jgi:L-seryl-tRNA(Ser) seleniumtransferase
MPVRTLSSWDSRQNPTIDLPHPQLYVMGRHLMSGNDPRRRIPRTDAVLADARVIAAGERLGAAIVKRAVHDAQTRARRAEIGPDDIVDAVLTSLPDTASALRPVLNGTGVILHTNLGRAALSAAAVTAIAAASGYVDVEYDLATGVRARRGRSTLNALLAAVPAAEDALVVNNGAAALVLAATALAAGREIIVSRGELVEIGDGFRIPDLIASTGARLREVGTTNRTHLTDYRSAVGPETGFVLKVHPSNFTVRGFTSAVSLRSLADLGIPVVADIGSGLLQPNALLPDEPDATTSLASGATIVTASGDKLLGGPQAGLIVGRRDIVNTLRRHPLARALRVDKLTLAGLEATLTGPVNPTRRALHADPVELQTRTESLTAALTGHGVRAQTIPSTNVVGGGGAPDLVLPGWAVELPEAFAIELRIGRPPIVTRVEHGRCVLDLRCIPAAEDEAVRRAIVSIHESLQGNEEAPPRCT